MEKHRKFVANPKSPNGFENKPVEGGKCAQNRDFRMMFNGLV